MKPFLFILYIQSFGFFFWSNLDQTSMRLKLDKVAHQQRTPKSLVYVRRGARNTLSYHILQIFPLTCLRNIFSIPLIILSLYNLKRWGFLSGKSINRSREGEGACTAPIIHPHSFALLLTLSPVMMGGRHDEME